MSDASGVLDFTYYYYPQVEVTNVVTEGAALTEQRASSKAIRVTDTSGRSTANSVIDVTDYVKRIINEGPTPTNENIALNPPPTFSSGGKGARGGPSEVGTGNRVKLV